MAVWLILITMSSTLNYGICVWYAVVFRTKTAGTRKCLIKLASLKTNTTFYVYGSVHRWSVSIIVQRDATQSSVFIILQVHSTCFGCQPHPSSGVHKTVTTAFRTVQLPPSNVAKLVWPRWREVAAQKIWPVPEAVVTVLCTPDDGCGWHLKHVEWTCRIIGCFVLQLVGQLLIQIPRFEIESFTFFYPNG